MGSPLQNPSSFSVPFLDEVLRSNWWPLLLPIGYGVFRFIEYIGRRWVEGKPADERIEQYGKLLDLQRKLDENKMTIGDLERLRSQVLGGEVANAIVVAEQYTNAAMRLVKESRNVGRNATEATALVTWDPDKEMTQAEMNALSAEKAREADGELTALVATLMGRLGADEARALQLAQDQWDVFRRLEAEREAKVWEGGSIRPLLYNAKLESLTRERIASLEGDAKGQEGEELQVRLARTPRNLYEHLERGVPRDRVKEILGLPSYIHGDRWLYRYAECQLEVAFGEDGGLSEWVLALCHGATYKGDNPVVDAPLGKLTLADVLEADPQAVLRFRWSMRTEELYICVRVGPPGAWEDYYFGALATYSGAGQLQDVAFEWDRDAEKLVSDPRAVLINWIGVGGALEAPYFSWFIK